MIDYNIPKVTTIKLYQNFNAVSKLKLKTRFKLLLMIVMFV